jgi:hypothetical protein
MRPTELTNRTTDLRNTPSCCAAHVAWQSCGGAGRGVRFIVALRQQRRPDTVGREPEVEGVAVQWATQHATNTVAVLLGDLVHCGGTGARDGGGALPHMKELYRTRREPGHEVVDEV